MKTALLASPAEDFKTWLRENLAGRDLLNLNPSDLHFGPPGVLRVWRGESTAWTRFYGSRDPARSPHILISTLAEAVRKFNPSVLLLPAFRTSPVLSNVIRELLRMYSPDALIVGSRTAVPAGGWASPAQVQIVDLPDAVPIPAQEGIRKAHWLQLWKEGREHAVPLGETTFSNARIGAGVPVTQDQLRISRIPWATYAELSHRSLFVVTEHEPSEAEVAIALDAFGVAKAHLLGPNDLNGTYCGLARLNGDELGIGFIEKVDWSARTVVLRANAVPPVPIPVLHLGSIRTESNGRELAELSPWQV